ncbi:MAG TPA: hypothetical protein VGX50_01095, partial [Longimicrobium sp.]|nr:hypothetical protein [Longimicrobium sp.]
LAAVLAAVAGPPARAQQLPPARQIVDRHVQAIGGRPALARFQQRRIVSETTLPNGATMTADAYQAAPNKTFVRTELPGVGTVLAGHDGAVAWSSDPARGARALGGDELGEALRQAEFWEYLDPAAAYRSLETVGEKTVGGRPCWEVRMVHASGAEAHGCFDKESGLLAQTSTQAGAMRLDVTISEYRDFDGIRMPSRMVTSIMGQEMTTTITSVSHEPFSASIFAVPAEVRARQGAPRN